MAQTIDVPACTCNARSDRVANRTTIAASIIKIMQLAGPGGVGGGGGGGGGYFIGRGLHFTSHRRPLCLFINCCQSIAGSYIYLHRQTPKWFSPSLITTMCCGLCVCVCVCVCVYVCVHMCVYLCL